MTDRTPKQLREQAQRIYRNLEIRVAEGMEAPGIDARLRWLDIAVNDGLIVLAVVLEEIAALKEGKG